MRARMKKYETFEKYMAEVDKWIEVKCGLTNADLPDWDYAGAYEDGMWPRTAARLAMEAAK